MLKYNIYFDILKYNIHCNAFHIYHYQLRKKYKLQRPMHMKFLHVHNSY